MEEKIEKYKEYFFLCKYNGVEPISYAMNVDYSEHWEEVKEMARMENVCNCCGVKHKDLICQGHDEECHYYGNDSRASCYGRTRKNV